VKRDNEILRNLLIEFEKQDDWLISVPSYMSMPPEKRQRQHHVHLLLDAGLLAPVGRDTFRLTNAGHDFLEAMRDEGIWTRTKQVVAETGGNATLEIVKQLAVGFLKKKIRDHTDFDF